MVYKKIFFWVISVFLTFFNQNFASHQSNKPLICYPEDFDGCPEVPFFQTPENPEGLRRILEPNGYSFRQISSLTKQVLDANRLLMKLLMMQQNRPCNSYIAGQKTTLQIVNEIEKVSKKVEIICLPDWVNLQPIINDYLMRTNSLKSSEIKGIQEELVLISGSFIKITKLREKIAGIIKSDKCYKVFLMIIENSKAV